MRPATTRPKPATFGQSLNSVQVGPFLLTETYHRRGLHLPKHEHATASLNFVLSGEYGESFRGRFEALPADVLQYKHAGAEHANRFNDAHARCVLIEVSPDPLTLCLGEQGPDEPDIRREPRLALLAARVHRLMRIREDVAELVLEELVTELFATFASGIPLAASTAISDAEDLLRSGFREPWSLREVARQVGLHSAHLGRAFRERHGCTLGEFVRKLRVLHVARKLRDTNDAIAQLAHEAGFADQSHCTRVFKRLMGVPPAQYRASVRSSRCTARSSRTG